MPRRKKGMLALAGSGDAGTTGLLGGGRASKADARIDAYGTVDEASSALGLAKAMTQDSRVREICEDVQRGLYRVGAELATNPESGALFATVGPADVAGVESIMRELEAQVPMPEGFVLPGVTAASGALDVARAVARRAERRTVELAEAGGTSNPELLRYLNRVGLLLFVLARYEEHVSGVAAKPARSQSTARLET